MSIKSIAAKLFAQKNIKKTQLWANNPIATQKKVLQKLIKEAKQTQFGIDHHFDQIKMRRILPTKFQFGIMRRSNRMWTKWFKAKISYGRKTALFC
jgi:hypothetical protein